MSRLEIGRGKDKMTAFGIGSCVVVVCYDPGKEIAGMFHGILPEKPAGKPGEPLKYMDTGIEFLVKCLISEELSINKLKAKIFGGAKMFEVGTSSDSIGERNIKAAKEALAAKNIE
ncbi:MAG: chemotaxis protein CheD, partial [bacterium]